MGDSSKHVVNISIVDDNDKLEIVYCDVCKLRWSNAVITRGDEVTEICYKCLIEFAEAIGGSKYVNGR